MYVWVCVCMCIAMDWIKPIERDSVKFETDSQSR